MKKNIMKKFNKFFVWVVAFWVFKYLFLSHIPFESSILKGDGVEIILGICYAVSLILLAIYSSILLYSMYKLIYEKKGDISPGKAVGFLYIPIFNVFWSFYVKPALVGRINKYLDEKEIQYHISVSKWVVVVAMLLSIISILAGTKFGGWGLLMLFCGLMLEAYYAYECVKGLTYVEEFQSRKNLSSEE